MAVWHGGRYDLLLPARLVDQRSKEVRAYGVADAGQEEGLSLLLPAHPVTQGPEQVCANSVAYAGGNEG
jgi:hypothetical protein